MADKRIVYYAHPLNLYGTRIEEMDIKYLRLLGMDVINPADPAHQAGYKAEGFSYFTKLVDAAHALAFRAFLDGKIGSGVAIEIQHARSLRHPVIELPNHLDSRFLTPGETQQYLYLLGQR